MRCSEDFALKMDWAGPLHECTVYQYQSSQYSKASCPRVQPDLPLPVGLHLSDCDVQYMSVFVRPQRLAI